MALFFCRPIPPINCFHYAYFPGNGAWVADRCGVLKYAADEMRGIEIPRQREKPVETGSVMRGLECPADTRNRWRQVKFLAQEPDLRLGARRVPWLARFHVESRDVIAYYYSTWVLCRKGPRQDGTGRQYGGRWANLNGANDRRPLDAASKIGQYEDCCGRHALAIDPSDGMC